MNQLTNAFSLLELDVTDDKVQAAEDDRRSANDTGKGSSGDVTQPRIADSQQCLEIVPGDYNLPLVWIDLEMTGLDVEVDRILEIACIITDGKLAKSVEGPDLVIHQTKECMDRMGEWCQDHHAASGLTQRVLSSTTTEQEAEEKVINFVKKIVGTHTPLLAGNSVYVDFIFLKKHMPRLASLFSHVVVDVSSVKALCIRWYPKAVSACINDGVHKLKL